MCAQNEKSMRREDSEKVHSLEAALQESQAELKAEKLLLQQVCCIHPTTVGLGSLVYYHASR